MSRRLQISLALGSVAVLFAATVAINTHLSWRPVSIDFPTTSYSGTNEHLPIAYSDGKLWMLGGARYTPGRNRTWKVARNWNRRPLSVVRFSVYASAQVMCSGHDLIARAGFRMGKINLTTRQYVFVRSFAERTYSDQHGIMAPGPVNLLSLSPDGKRLAVSSHLYGLGAQKENLAGFCELGLVLFDTTNGTQIERQSAFEGGFSDFGWSPDSRQIAGITVDGFVFVLDATTGKLRLKFRAHKLWGAQIAWSPDGKTLVTASNPRVGVSPTAIEFALKSGVGFMLRGKGSTTMGQGKNKIVIAHTANGDATADGQTERLLKRFDARTGQQIGNAVPLQTGAVEIAFSPDGSQIALGEHEFALLLNARTLATERRLDILKPPAPISFAAPVCVAWSEDGATLATSTSRGLTLWRTR